MLLQFKVLLVGFNDCGRECLWKPVINAKPFICTAYGSYPYLSQLKQTIFFPIKNNLIQDTIMQILGP